MAQKICCICKKEKPVESFSKSRREKDGLKKYCKECAAAESKRYREKHRQEINERKKGSYWRSKDRAEERTAAQLAEGFRVCTCCGVRKPITDFGQRGNGGFYSQCRSCVNELTKQYAAENHDLVIERKRRYHKEYKAKIDEYNRQYYKSHSGEIKQRVRDWEAANPERRRENEIIGLHDRRFRKAGLNSKFTRGDWKTCKEYFTEDGEIRCAYCGKPIKRVTIDHVIPITSGGGNAIDNIVPACSRCNSSKSSRPFEEWYREQPFYSQDRENKIKTYLNQ